VRRGVAVSTQQLRLVFVAEECHRSGVHEREVAVVIDDVQAVRRLLGDLQRNAVSDSRPAR
jgi:hypothetical protein